ncbi:NUDIX domain-containing protein [Nocardia salmonicida]|uniref:NUDIX domain-containing protein n=1 Tax=Nocardia salmonicida TaxID=53431 RepID=UPI000A044AF0|nr:NUDIX domain-containing protein [Nocardia salmonicida]MBC7299515.1 NUDIX domain-containing protein [Nocardia sp.]
MTPLKVHATASTFVFGRFTTGWRLGLIQHPRLKRTMIAGGHVEEFEVPAEAAVREVLEETGLRVRLLRRPTVPLPQGYPLHVVTDEPWWTTLTDVPGDNHLAEPHRHLDHQYVAIADSVEHVRTPEHPFGWFGPDDLDELEMFDDTVCLAAWIFPHIDQLADQGLGHTWSLSHAEPESADLENRSASAESK